MDEDTATRFVSSLVKSIQALCNGYIDFSSSIEVVGHIHLNIDRNKKLDYVLTEEVSKSVSEGATVFASHSYHSHPPPSASSKTSGDASNQNRRKSQVSRDNDPLSITSLPPEVPNTSRSQSSSRVEENSDSSGSANYSQDFTPVKSENNRTSCQVQESLDRRRKGVPFSQTHRTQSPAAKRPRNHDTSSSVQNPGFDVIEIKEEPDDEPSVYFGDNSSSNMAAGQADIQTPDFSNVVMESLDRVGQIEGTQLVAGSDGGQQHQPFPVMLHTNSGMPSSSSQGPGPSLNPQSTASTSGGVAPMPVVRGDTPGKATGEKTQSKATDEKAQAESFKRTHYLQSIHSTTSTESGRQRSSQSSRPCKVCQENGLSRESAFFCASCPEQPGFCSTGSCFVNYHNKLGYSLLKMPHLPVGKGVRQGPQKSQFHMKLRFL